MQEDFDRAQLEVMLEALHKFTVPARRSHLDMPRAELISYFTLRLAQMDRAARLEEQMSAAEA